jgi:hypothetical protein
MQITYVIFLRTLQKIYTFVEAQHDGNLLKHFFRRSEINTLLKDCQAGLQKAQTVFKVCFTSFIYWESKRLHMRQIKSGATLLLDLAEMEKDTQKMHQELLELISSLSDCTISDEASSVGFHCHCVIRKLNFNSLLAKLAVHTELPNKVLTLQWGVSHTTHCWTLKLKVTFNVAFPTPDLSRP